MMRLQNSDNALVQNCTLDLAKFQRRQNAASRGYGQNNRNRMDNQQRAELRP